MAETATAPKIGQQRSARYKRAMEGLFIRSEYGGLVPMRFSQSQDILWQHVAPKLDAHDKLWFIVLKSRQVYSSTFFCALSFIRTMETAGCHSLVLAHDLFTSHDLFDKVKTFYEHLPLPKLREPRVNEITFPFRAGTSRYRVISAGSVAKGRGTTQTCMLLSEIPSWPHPDIAVGLFQAMPDLPNTMLVEESTAKGITGNGRLFYEEWTRAVRRESDLEPIFIPWFAMPKYRRKPAIHPEDWDDEERILADTYGGPTGLEVRPDKSQLANVEAIGEQLAWRRYAIKTKCQNSLDVFHQEFPASADEAFIASGMPAFDRLALLKQRANICDPVWRGTLENGKLVERRDGEIRLWKHPEEGSEYVIGADTAEGLVGGDYACAQIVDCRSMEQVGSIHGHIQPYEFACILNAVGRYFKKATLCIEVFPMGHRVQDHLIREFMYPRLHQWKGKPDKIKAFKANMYGWETNVWSRPLLVGAGQRALNHGLATVHEDGLLTELMHFSKNDDGKYEAEVGHDDRVMALLLALRSREENFVERKLGPQFTAEDASGVRIVESDVFQSEVDEKGNIVKTTATGDKRRVLSKILREKANTALKHWMGY